jgi:DNA-binding response OmpR family regulator
VAQDNGTVVVIEDDPHISDLVAMYLRRDGFRVLQSEQGTAGLEHAEREHARLVIVDVGLPGQIDGFEVCRRLRRRGDTPVVLLTARDDEVDRVLGLELGADDYVTKPFSARELVARVHAILRRSTAGAPAGDAGTGGRGGPPPVHTIGGVEVDMGRREVRTAEGVVPLATRELDLLAYLAANRGLALSRRQLLDGVWGPDWYGDERTVDVHVRQLRKKLGDALPLATVWGVGYRLG